MSDPETCYQRSSGAIANLSVGGREWYRIKMMQMLASIEMQQFSRLKYELENALTLENAPLVFKATVYTYYAKVLILEGSDSEGREYLHRALTLVRDINTVLPDPFRSAEILNLYSYVPELNDEAVAFAESLIPGLSLVIDPVGLAELYTSLGHTYKYANNLDSSLHYYLQALKNHDQQAEAFLKRSIAAWGISDATKISKNHAQLALVDTYIMQAKITEAGTLLNQSNLADMPLYQKELFDRLTQTIAKRQNSLDFKLNPMDWRSNLEFRLLN